MNMLEVRPDGLRRKFPRLFLAFREESSTPLSGLFVEWPDRTSSAVLDLSEAGLVVSARGQVHRVRAGQNFAIKLRNDGREPQTLQVSVLRATAQAFFLSLEALTIGGRLKMGQEERELLVRTGWKRLPASGLPAAFVDSEWWHSAFDTNLWMWREADGTLKRFMLESEGVALVDDGQSVRFVKSPAAFDESKGYMGPFVQPLPNRVEAGHGWTERLAHASEFSALPAGIWQELAAKLPRAVAPATVAGKIPHV